MTAFSMDHSLLLDGDFADDIESCRTGNEKESPVFIGSAVIENSFPGKVSRGLVSLDVSVKRETGLNFCSNPRYGNEICPENVQVVIEADNKVAGVVDAELVEKKTEKEKRKSLSAKKPPKPPRPPRGLSVDAADQKLIKELAELAVLKRERIEKMKALKKMKATKVPSSLSSSSGSLFAMLCTVLFCVVIICQGMSSRNNTTVSFSSSLVSAGATESSFIVVENQLNLSASARSSSHSLPPDLLKHVSGSDAGSSEKELMVEVD